MKKFRNKTIKKVVAVVMALTVTAVSVPSFMGKMTVKASNSDVDFDANNIKMSFAVMTDLHLHQSSDGSVTAVRNQIQRYANTVATLNNLAITNGNDAGLDLLMLAGDYCDIGSEFQANTFAAATREILNALDQENDKAQGTTQFIMTYGNHETESGNATLPHMTYAEWEEVLRKYNLHATANYGSSDQAPWGCDHEIVEKDGKTYHFLSLETYTYVSPTNLFLNEALEWLDDELAEITASDNDDYIYFACHGPTQESGLYVANTDYNVNGWWGASESGVDGGTYGNDAQYPEWKATSGDLDDVLQKYPQVVHFSGHYHYSNILESSIMQDKYTSIALAALSESALGNSNNGFYDNLDNTEEAALYNGYSLLVEVDAEGNQRITRVKMDTTYGTNGKAATVTYQADDTSTADLKNGANATVEVRNESKWVESVSFESGTTADTMTPWVMKAPNTLQGADSHLYTYSREARKGTPVFPEDASLEITNLVKNSDDSVDFTVTFDTVGAKTADVNYVMRYELELYNQAGEKLNAGKTYDADAYGVKAKTGSYWFIGNWASGRDGIVSGHGTTHKDATKLSYDLSLSASELTDTTGIYAKLYAVDEFGGKSKALTFGNKSEVLNTGRIVQNGGFEKGKLANWFNESTAASVKEAKKVKLSFSFGNSADGVSELVFTSEDDLSALPTQTVSVLKGSEEHAGWTLAYAAGYLWLSNWYTPAVNDVIQIPKGLKITCGGETYEIAEDCAMKYDGTTWAACDATPTEEVVGPIAVVQDEKRSGEYSLKIEREDTTEKFVRTDIHSISAETEYQLTYYINTSVYAAVEATIYEYSFNNKIVGKHQVEVNGGTSDWKKGELTFTTSAGADKLGLILTVKGAAGTVYVDDVTIKAQEAEKVQFSYDDSNGDGDFNVKDIVRMKSALTNGKDKLAAPKYADRNGDGTFDGKDTEALRAKAAGIADDFTNVLVTDGDIKAFGAKLQSDNATAYMATGKTYSDQTFTFTAEYQEGLRLGVRMPEGAPGDFYDQNEKEGLIISLFKQYAGLYMGNAHNEDAESLLSYTGAQGELVPGETYVFSVNMTDNQDGTKKLSLEARQKSVLVAQLHRTFAAEQCANIPKEGQFIVWAQQKCQEMLYQVVETEKITRLDVPKNGIDGVVELYEKQYTYDTSAIFAYADTYTTERYRFTINCDGALNNGETNNGKIMAIGMNKAAINEYVFMQTGLVLELYTNDWLLRATESNESKEYKVVDYGDFSFAAGKEYTFETWLEDHTVHLCIYTGETLVSHTSATLTGDGYTWRTSGYFQVWSWQECTKIAWDMPEKETSVVEIDADTAAGTAFVANKNPGSLANSAYIVTDSMYTSEAIEFTTTLEQTDHIVLGARMSGKANNPATYSGLYIRFTEDGTGYTIYNQSTVVATGTFNTALVAGTEYTFRLSVGNTVTHKLRFDVEKDGQYIHHGEYDIASANVPSEGYFMVWSMDAYQSIDYSQIIVGGWEPKVIEGENTAGSVVLSGKSGGNYPAVRFTGPYTTEVLKFTTRWEGNFQVGLHLTKYDHTWTWTNGIVLNFWSDLCQVTRANGNGTSSLLANISYDKFADRQEYTFEVSYDATSKKLNLSITQGDTVVKTDSVVLSNAGDIPAAGEFWIWSTSYGQKVSYEMPMMAGNSVTMTGTTGTAILKDIKADADYRYAYLAVDGDYSTETFTFKTVIDDPANFSIPIGVRMQQRNQNWQQANGFVLLVEDDILVSYCISSSHGLQTSGLRYVSVKDYIKAGAEHTFEVTVVNNEKIHLRITGGTKTYETDFSYNSENYKTHWDHMPATGDFIVWSEVEGQKITYEVK